MVFKRCSFINNFFFLPNENSAFEFFHTKISYETMFYKSLTILVSSKKNCKLMKGTEGVIIT